MKLKSKLGGMLLSFVLIFTIFQSTASAYNKTGWRFAGTSFISYKWGASLKEGVIKTGWTNAASAWRTSTKDNVRFFYDSKSVNYLTRFTDADSSYYGKMLTTTNSNKMVTKFEGFENDNAVKVSSVAKSTGVHELGHSLGLDHVSGTSIMNSSRDRTKITTPQTDDLNGIKSIYGFKF
ncbi:matrixin family metalloprotease [Bacillus anthracis]|uniref:matrixin family metalloprotease n=1 Tax=Bacillus anthracis TaxID=1392 RepID=UPI0009C81861|nr:matrixin family metalloprotease [Bacillus anthracis]OPD56208.1 hypothetical protein BVG01_25400 [Bacillus anthracis]